MKGTPKATASASPLARMALALSRGELLVGDVGSAEGFLQGYADAVVGLRFAGADEGDAALAQLTGDMAEGFQAVGIAHVVGVGTRRQVYADALGAPYGDRRVGDFQQQARAVLDGAAVAVGALVGAVLEELVEQVAVGAVDLHAVEAGGLGPLGALAVGLDDVGDLLGVQRARGDVGTLRAHQADVPLGGDGARRHRQLAIQVERIGNPPTCQSCRKMRPPAACTALVTLLQPRTWSSDQMPGVSG